MIKRSIIRQLRNTIKRDYTNITKKWKKPDSLIEYKLNENDIKGIEQRFGKPSQYIKLSRLPLSIVPNDIFRIAEKNWDEIKQVEYVFNRDDLFQFTGQVNLKFPSSEKALEFCLARKSENTISGTPFQIQFIPAIIYDKVLNNNILNSNHGSSTTVLLHDLPVVFSPIEINQFVKSLGIKMAFEDNIKLNIKTLNFNNNKNNYNLNHLNDNLFHLNNIKINNPIHLGYLLRFENTSWAYRAASLMSNMPFRHKKYNHFNHFKIRAEVVY